MTTVITFQNSGTTRRCDAHCHNAESDKCECICGGKNHGVGIHQATQNAQKDMEAIENAEGFRVGPLQFTLDLGLSRVSKVTDPQSNWVRAEDNEILVRGVK